MVGRYVHMRRIGDPLCMTRWGDVRAESRQGKTTVVPCELLVVDKDLLNDVLVAECG